MHLLRDHSDIGFFASIINEATEAKAVVKVAEQDDLVLKPKIGSSATAVETASASVKSSPKAPSGAVEADVTARPKVAMAAIALIAPSWPVRRPFRRSR